MPEKKSLAEWASIAEIIASIGVIVSLTFLTYSISQSNKITRAQNDNLLYELQDSLYGGLVDNTYLVDIQLKLANNQTLDESEQWRYAPHLWRMVNLWELAFDRHEDGLLSTEKWTAWNAAFENEVIVYPTGMPEELWELSKETYGQAFRAHVDAAYDSY